MATAPTAQRARLLAPPNNAEMRRTILAEIDNADFTRFHTRIVLTSGAGFFTDAYDLFAINLCADMIGQAYSEGGRITPPQLLGLKIAAPIGNMVGQIVFGWLADKYGRNKIYGVELIIMVSATFAQVIAGNGRQLSIWSSLIIWRFIMGVGIGGDYPLSAVLTSEFAAVRFRGRMMSAVVAMQGFGNAAASIVSLIVTVSFKNGLMHSPADAADRMWRIIIAIGMIPGLAALWSRLTIPESPRFTMDVERNLDQARRDGEFVQNGRFDVISDLPIIRPEVPEASRGDFIAYFSHWPNFLILFCCAWSWLVDDFSFYGLGLNPDIIFNILGYDTIYKTPRGTPLSSKQIYNHFINVSIGNTVIAVAGLIPGYWATFFLIDKWGRKKIQIMGFSVLFVLFTIMGFGYDRITHKSPKAFAVLYALAYNFQNFGPNVTTWVIPGELFVTRYRVFCDGISAASGKLGAVLAQLLFYYTKDIGGKDVFFKHILEIIALLMITGILATLYLPETRGQSLESLSGEEEGDANFGPPQRGDAPAARTSLMESIREALRYRPRKRSRPIELETIGA